MFAYTSPSAHLLCKYSNTAEYQLRLVKYHVYM
jgi:hypothetical protein